MHKTETDKVFDELLSTGIRLIGDTDEETLTRIQEGREPHMIISKSDLAKILAHAFEMALGVCEEHLSEIPSFEHMLKHCNLEKPFCADNTAIERDFSKRISLERLQSSMRNHIELMLGEAAYLKT